MIKMTELMRELLDSALEDGACSLVGTVSGDGHPQISPKGSVGMFNDDHLFYWERALKSALTNVEENPHVMVYYRNPNRATEMPYRGACLRFYGEAHVVTEGPDRDRAWELTIPAEKQRDPDRKGVAVIIKLDRIEDLGGTVLMKRD